MHQIEPARDRVIRLHLSERAHRGELPVRRDIGGRGWGCFPGLTGRCRTASRVATCCRRTTAAEVPGEGGLAATRHFLSHADAVSFALAGGAVSAGRQFRAEVLACLRSESSRRWHRNGPSGCPCRFQPGVRSNLHLSDRIVRASAVRCTECQVRNVSDPSLVLVAPENFDPVVSRHHCSSTRRWHLRASAATCRTW